ncbi:hypothetical protein [Thiolapillus sp.]|uniref:hypothetical protein n=1 Tax=Thiolapillus sp. TaxID=2017437 RepID=UPI0025E83F3C|nr:hypothetical protein [Thiolapillus sp.]
MYFKSRKTPLKGPVPGEWLKQQKRIRSIAGHNFQISAELQKLNAVSAQFPTINFSGPGFR